MKQSTYHEEIAAGVRAIDRDMGIAEQILAKRGMVDPELVREFLSPDYQLHTHDPMLLPDMGKAVDRLVKAFEKQEKIHIFSDYDADGIPGAVLLFDALRLLGYQNVSVYIPHRHNEGFGLNVAAIDTIATAGTTLVVTIDCGSTDTEEVVRAVEQGIDVIITDHHEVPDVPPPAFALINPKRVDSQYPFKELCGAAVAFKLAKALMSHPAFAAVIKDGQEKWLLDLVGIATLSDMVPLIGENRVLASYGLKVIRKTRRPGLRELIRRLRIPNEYITEDDVVFSLTPRINAASRMAHPIDAFNVLSATVEAASKQVDGLIEINDQRKQAVAVAVKKARRMVEALGDECGCIVVGDPAWGPGILGLIANNLLDHFGRTAFVWGREESPAYKGSVRSLEREHCVHIMKAAAEVDPALFEDFGGHAGSGGFSVGLDSIHRLSEVLVAAHARLYPALSADASAEAASNRNVVEADMDMQPQHITAALYKDMQRLAPFGMGNKKPVIRLKGILAKADRFGADKQHLSLTVADEWGCAVKVIKFFGASQYEDFKQKIELPVEVLGALELSLFAGKKELRLRLL